MDQLLQAGANSSTPSIARPEGETRRQIELEFHEDNRIRMQSQERVEEHIRREYNVREHEKVFKASLHFVVQKGHINIVILLLNAGVDV